LLNWRHFEPRFDKTRRVANLRLDGSRIRSLQARLNAGQLVFKFRQVRGDCRRISVAKSAELVRNAALDLTGLPAHIRIALTSRRECFLELFFERFQRVGDDVEMQNSRLEAGQKLPLEILLTNQQTAIEAL